MLTQGQHSTFPATLTFACHGIVEGLHMFEKTVGGLAKCIYVYLINVKMMKYVRIFIHMKRYLNLIANTYVYIFIYGSLHMSISDIEVV